MFSPFVYAVPPPTPGSPDLRPTVHDVAQLMTTLPAGAVIDGLPPLAQVEVSFVIDPLISNAITVNEDGSVTLLAGSYRIRFGQRPVPYHQQLGEAIPGMGDLIDTLKRRFEDGDGDVD